MSFISFYRKIIVSVYINNSIVNTIRHVLLKVPKIHRLQPHLLCVCRPSLSAVRLVVLQETTRKLIQYHSTAIRSHRHLVPFCILDRYGDDWKPELTHWA